MWWSAFIWQVLSPRVCWRCFLRTNPLFEEPAIDFLDVLDDLGANNQTMDNNAETHELLTKALLGLFQHLMLAFHEPDRSIG